jgi:16S rRNA (guanine527-N7)-methyltransferase
MLKRMLSEYNLSFDDNVLQKLIDYQSLLLEKNKHLNLTRIDEWNQSLVLNIVDSLLFYSPFSRTQGKFLDIGTGGGLPGIPLAIATGRQGVLMDSVKKKIAADEEFINALGLQRILDTTTDRAEEYARHHKQEFGCVVARAVAQSDVLLEYARPLLNQTGCVILTKGNVTTEEISNADKVSEMLGFKLVSRETYELPKGLGHRELFTYQVYKPSRISLPRPIGDAKKKPLSLR